MPEPALRAIDIRSRRIVELALALHRAKSRRIRKLRLKDAVALQ